MHLKKNHLFIAMMLSIFAVSAMACTPQAPVDPNPTTSTSSTTTTTSTPAPTTWEFKLRVGVPDYLVTKYGGLAAIRAKVDQQISEVNTHYAVGFTKPIVWKVNEFYTFTQPASLERNAGRGSSDYLLLYSENEVVDDGGWWPANWSIVIRWTPSMGGVFGQYGADSLAHELGHARGMIDSYGLGVNTNPIGGGTYTPAPGFMTYPYGATLFDSYNTAVANASAQQVYNDDHVVWQSLPTSYSVVVKNLAGSTVSGASVSLYPVPWFSYTVSTSASLTGVTATNGSWALPSNPLNVTSGVPWNIGTPMFLVKATSGDKTGYGWLTLPDAGLAYFANPNAPYSLTVTVS